MTEPKIGAYVHQKLSESREVVDGPTQNLIASHPGLAAAFLSLVESAIHSENIPLHATYASAVTWLIVESFGVIRSDDGAAILKKLDTTPATREQFTVGELQYAQQQASLGSILCSAVISTAYPASSPQTVDPVA